MSTAVSAMSPVERKDNLATYIQLYRDIGRGRKVFSKPRPPRPAEAYGKREFLVRTETGVEPSRRVAKTLTGVAAPGGIAAVPIVRLQAAFSQLRAPA